MEKSEQINELATALAKAQAKFTAVPKKGKATIKMDNGASYTYEYAELSDIIEMARIPLSENQIAISQGNVTTPEGRVVVTTLLLHSSGQWLQNSLAMPMASGKNATQQVGSTSTYGRRYDYGSMLGIATEKDADAAALAEKIKNAKDIKPATPAKPSTTPRFSK